MAETSVTLTEYEPSDDDVISKSITSPNYSTTNSSAGNNAQLLPESVAWRVTRSWELVEQNLEKVGIDFFLRVFEERPDLLDLFRFGGQASQITRGNGNLPPALKNHAMIVMKAIGLCVGGLTQLESLIPTLRSLGEVHKTAGVLNEHYGVIFNHLMNAISAELGPNQWDGEMRDAWELVFRSLTTIMKNPKDLLQIEPMEGWGMANALACMYICILTPFRMAGFTLLNINIERTLNICEIIVFLITTLDMCSHWLTNQVRHRRRPPPSRSVMAIKKNKKRNNNIIGFKQTIQKFIFPIKFRYSKFIRSLKMDQWSNRPRMDAIILISYILQYIFMWIFSSSSSASSSSSSNSNNTTVNNAAGIHWTAIFGLLRMVAVTRLVHFIQCAENNLLLRVRMEYDEREYLRVVKLIGITIAVIHFAACVWNIVARIELGPNTTEVPPQGTGFFPNMELLLGSSGIFNSYVHSIHWAWVNLAGIGDVDSNPETTLECVTTLLVHICGATLYTITTGNVVNILEVLSKKQSSFGSDLADIGELMQNCHVPGEDQKRILQAFMMHNLSKKRNKGGGDDGDDNENDSATTIPDAVNRLPPHIRMEVTYHVRAEAIKRRDPAFHHCGKEFLFSLCSGLTGTALFLPGDYIFKEGETVKNEVTLIEKGKVEIISKTGEAIRMLQRGDVIGKRWLLSAAAANTTTTGTGTSMTTSSNNNNDTSMDDDEEEKTTPIASLAETTLRAHTACTLSTGFTDPSDIMELQRRYENDFFSLETGRDSINKIRQARQVRLRRSTIKTYSSFSSDDEEEEDDEYYDEIDVMKDTKEENDPKSENKKLK